jgi:hypothetical protein
MSGRRPPSRGQQPPARGRSAFGAGFSGCLGVGCAIVVLIAAFIALIVLLVT